MGTETDNLSDHDLLIRIDERVYKLDGCMKNVDGRLCKHIDQHSAWRLALIVAGTSAVMSLGVSLIVVLVGS